MSHLWSLSRVRVGRRRFAALAVGLAAVAVPSATAHADLAVNYPTGCSIVNAGVVQPDSCSYVAVSDTEDILFTPDLGVTSVSTDAGCAATLSYPGEFASLAQTPGCRYTLTVSGPNAVIAVPDPSATAAAHVGGCVDAGVACSYTAVSTTGAVIVGAVETGSTMTATVRDLNTGLIVVNCGVTSFGAAANLCQYGEVPEHSYQLSFTAFTPVAVAAAAG